uniref:E3 ubiquitin-protein ligase Topors n=1 Tax=Nothobranchius furzeri TaxID=105023 RepID=A0A8C6M9T8_NOTFU
RIRVSDRGEPGRQQRKMPLPVRSSSRRKRKNAAEERPGDCSAEVREANASSLSTAAASSSPPGTSSGSARAVLAAEETSPDSKCPICLDRFNNLAYLDHCLHRFCFPCIQEWSHNKAECPLCKQPFASILHSVRAEDDFKEYTLQPPPTNSSVAATVGRGGGADSAEGGIIFNQLTGFQGTAAPLDPSDRASRRLISRLVARQRLQREGGAIRQLREREALAFRRMLYRCGIRVRGVAGANGNHGPQCDITAENFRQNPAHLNRLRPWLQRELKVLYGSHGSLVDIVQRIIVARLARHGLESPPALEEDLRPFLLARTEHFLHELASFARSPLSMDAYDLQAVYEPPPTTTELGELSSSSDGSSVIAISEEEEETGSSLSLSVWDDETPGPSYSIAEPSSSLAPPPSSSPAPPEAASAGGEDGEREEECLIVGYKKPMAERTPELVQLSSDSEVEEGGKEEVTAEKAPPLSPAPSSSYQPVVPPSTSGAHRVEEARQSETRRRRSRSWSGSSVGSRKSVCSVVPGQQSTEDGQRRRRRRGRDRSSEEPRRSGTLANPNRSIYPPMMRRSPSPYDSSANSCSPLPPSPLDSSSDFHQISPLTSPISSPSISSNSSPFCLSPPRIPPTPTRSPSERPHHADKPGGKRKYKSRHLDSSTKDPSWRPNGGRRDRRRRRRTEKPRKVLQESSGLGEQR